MLEHVRKREEPALFRFYAAVVLEARRAAEVGAVDAVQPVIGALVDDDVLVQVAVGLHAEGEVAGGDVCGGDVVERCCGYEFVHLTCFFFCCGS